MQPLRMFASRTIAAKPSKVFIVISSFTMLNMLLGILVEVVANTAEGGLGANIMYARSSQPGAGEKHKEKNVTVRQDGTT